MSISPPLAVAAVLLLCLLPVAPQSDVYDTPEIAQPPAINTCNGIFLTYNFVSREKVFPRVKNASAQAYAFQATASITNAGKVELPAWKMFIGFQHEEILVSVGNGELTEGPDFPANVANGTYISGYPQADLKTAIETAGDLSQIQVEVELKGTQFGVKPPNPPMPKTIRLANPGYKCPAPTKQKTEMYVCCRPNPKFKAKKIPSTTNDRFQPRRNGDLTIAYDILQSFDNNYLAQVTLNNNNPLGRMDNWNLTWEWMRGEFIYNMRGAYTYTKDPSSCIFGPPGKYYKDFDFTPVMSCEKKPVIVDLPPERANDTKIGKLPYCCNNGTLLPNGMDPSKSMAIFQIQVFKTPPDLNRTALFPPQHWRIDGFLNPSYRCGPPVRVNPMEFPDPSGLMSHTYAIASWQVVCNIIRPKKKQSRCCVSFSAFYNDSVVPCGTCACGCPSDDTSSTCDPNAPPLLLPPEALLVPFDNRTAKAKAWAKIKHLHLPNPMPCSDNCGVSINWHIFSDYTKGWTARITLFNWDDYTFKDWFVAVEMKAAFSGYDKAYSFNGTKMEGVNDTLFFQGLPGLNYLMGEIDGPKSHIDPRVPGKQQSIISFKKKLTPGIHVAAGDGFPSRVYFNGEECALPSEIPRGGAWRRSSGGSFLMVVVFLINLPTLDMLR